MHVVRSYQVIQPVHDLRNTINITKYRAWHRECQVRLLCQIASDPLFFSLDDDTNNTNNNNNNNYNNNNNNNNNNNKLHINNFIKTSQ